MFPVVPRRLIPALLALAWSGRRAAHAATGATGAEAPELPAWRRFAVPVEAAEGRPVLVFLIDDMGLNRTQSARAVALPGPLTLSWMPYAQDLPEQIGQGRAHGHETMVHMPMEPLGHSNPGPNALRTWLPPATNLGYLRAALDSIPGAVALNQHEASVASLSAPLMDLVMGELHTRGMGFVDSVTISHSVALRRALADGVPAVARDVFLDNSPDPAAIRVQLAQAEEMARRYGLSVSICHPRTTTMDVMERYLPRLAERGFVLWPVSAAIMAKNPVMVSGDPGR